MAKPRWSAWGHGTVYAVPYWRLSDDDEREPSNSPQAQQHMCLEHIARHKWIPLPMDGEVISAYKTARDERKAFERQLAVVKRLAKEGKDVAFVVKDIDRFGRKLSQMAAAFEEVEDAGARLYTCREGSFSTFLQSGVQATVAEQQSRDTGNRVRDMIENQWRNGWWKPGRVALGYRKRARTEEEKALHAPVVVLELDPEAAKLVEQCYRTYAKTRNLNAVMRLIALAPESVKGHRHMQNVMVRKLLSARVYIAETPDGHRGRWPAIIDRELFEEVQTLLATIKDRPAPQASGTNLLTGFLRCPKCGERMCGRNYAAKNQRQYTCVSIAKGARRGQLCYCVAGAEGLEATVLAKLRPILQLATGIHDPYGQDDALWLATLERTWRDGDVPGEVHDKARLADLRHQRSEVEQQLNEVTRRTTLRPEHDEYLAPLAYKLRSASLLSEHETLTKAIAEAEAALPVAPAKLTLREALAQAGDMAGFEQWDVPAQRGLLTRLVRTVTPGAPAWHRADPELVKVDLTPVGDALAWLAREQRTQASTDGASQ